MANNDFYGVAGYQWHQSGRVISGEDTPCLIAGVGKYKCIVKAKERVLAREFVVSGKK